MDHARGSVIGALSLADAEDVLVDIILLSRRNLLVHASSSVSTMASFLNPHLTLLGTE